MFTKIILCLSALTSTFTVIDKPSKQLTIENISINYNMMKSSDFIGNETYINYGKQENGTLPYILDFYRNYIDGYDFNLLTFQNGSRVGIFNHVTNISYDVSTSTYILTYGNSTAYINSASSLGGTCYNNIAVEVPSSYAHEFTVRFDVYSSTNLKLTYNLFCQPFYRLSRYQSSFNLFHLGILYTESSRSLYFSPRYNPYAYSIGDYYLFRNDFETVLYRSNVNIYNEGQYKMISSLFNFTSTVKYQILGNLNFDDYFRNYVVDLVDSYDDTDIIEDDLPSTYLYDFAIFDERTKTEFSYFYVKFIDSNFTVSGNATQNLTFSVYGYTPATQSSTRFITYIVTRIKRSGTTPYEITDLVTDKSILYSITPYFIKPNQIIDDVNLNYYSKYFNPVEFFLVDGDIVVPPPTDFSNSLGNVFNVIGLALTSFAGLFSIVIFPSVTIGTLLLIPLTLTLLFFVINLFKR